MRNFRLYPDVVVSRLRIATIAVAAVALSACGSKNNDAWFTYNASATSSTTASSTPVPTLPPTSLAVESIPTSIARTPSDATRLTLWKTITRSDLQPKSIVASGHGLFVAQNMMYRHNVAMFDADGNFVASISDEVNLAEFGIDTAGRGSIVKGSPVEASFTSDGRYVYVSNYKMYGNGWQPVADDLCQGRSWDPSFVYRIDTESKKIDRVIPVGSVPKFLAVSPDDSRLVVANWCSQDVSIIDTDTDREVKRIEVGLHPRGIAITKDSATAYVAVMGGAKIVRINLVDFSTHDITSVGATPRHLVLSPDDSILYVSNNKANAVRSIDTTTEEVLATVNTGTETRSMVLSDDARSLYVVNYVSGTLSKVRTSDMKVIQEVRTGVHPVGVAYDAVNRRVWVANYTGSLMIFAETSE